MQIRLLLICTIFTLCIFYPCSGKASETVSQSDSTQQFQNTPTVANLQLQSASRPGTNFLHLPDTISGYRQKLSESADDNGSSKLIKRSLTLSLLYYGWAVPTALDASNGRAYVASYMLLGGGGFFVPFLLTRDRPVTMGMAYGFSSGALLGIAHGWALTYAVGSDDIDGRVGLGISVATSIAEGIYGLSYARKHNLSKGQMAMIGHGGAWAGALAAPLPYFFDADDARPYAISGLLGSGLGIWAGNQLANKIPIADGDPQVMSTSAAVGAFLSIALVNSFTDDFNKGSLATLMTGTAAGLGLGIVKIKKRNYTNPNANLITLGAFAGGLVGLGAVYVAAGNASGEAYLWGSSLGAVGGFLLTDHLIRERRSPKLGNLKIQLNPVAFKNLLKPAPASFNPVPNPFGQPHLINASLRF